MTTEIHLFDYFKRIKVLKLSAAYDIFHDVLLPWVKDNCDKNTWRKEGMTVFSYRFEFDNPEDATAFKLRFGI